MVTVLQVGKVGDQPRKTPGSREWIIRLLVNSLAAMPLATTSLFHIPPSFNSTWTLRSYRTFCVWISLLSILARIVCDIHINPVHHHLCIVYYPSTYSTPSSSPPVRATVGGLPCYPDEHQPRVDDILYVTYNGCSSSFWRRSEPFGQVRKLKQ